MIERLFLFGEMLRMFSAMATSARKLTVSRNSMLTLIAVGTMGAMGPFWSMPSAMLTGTAAAGGIATITAIAGVGNLITPAVTGWLSAATGSQAYNQLLYGAVLAVGAALMFALVRPAAR